MKAYITTCCKEKSKILGEIPMLERYISDRIQSIHDKSIDDKVNFFVLSGKYGLLTPSNTIPYYDLILTDDNIAEISKKVKHQLVVYGVTEITLFANKEWINYITTIENACKAIDIKFEIEYLLATK